MTVDARRVAVLVSGRGSNLKALIDRASGYEIALAASNKPQAQALDVARAAGLPTWTLDSRGVDRELFEDMLTRSLEDHRVGTIALAGYMRLLSPDFIAQWRGRIVNIHPSLLPKYRGLKTHERALAAGEGATGCTVHVVTEELDSGKILAQTTVAIEPGDDIAALSERVLMAEHALYPATLAEFVER
ncbi:MAG TPA: phosphoribosylglycinamide formyltransferase [Sphingomicrobium sp.]|nr:phosphoribosylglycinamide formyltransferase [Sphingomicrobium sp.]